MEIILKQMGNKTLIQKTKLDDEILKKLKLSIDLKDNYFMKLIHQKKTIKFIDLYE